MEFKELERQLLLEGLETLESLIAGCLPQDEYNLGEKYGMPIDTLHHVVLGMIVRRVKEDTDAPSHHIETLCDRIAAYVVERINRNTIHVTMSPNALRDPEAPHAMATFLEEALKRPEPTEIPPQAFIGLQTTPIEDVQDLEIELRATTLRQEISDVLRESELPLRAAAIADRLAKKGGCSDVNAIGVELARASREESCDIERVQRGLYTIRPPKLEIRRGVAKCNQCPMEVRTSELGEHKRRYHSVALPISEVPEEADELA